MTLEPEMNPVRAAFYRFTDVAILWYVCLTPLIATEYAIIFSGRAIPGYPVSPI